MGAERLPNFYIKINYMFWIQPIKINRHTNKGERLPRKEFETLKEAIQQYRDYEIIISTYILDPTDFIYKLDCDVVTKMHLDLAEHL